MLDHYISELRGLDVTWGSNATMHLVNRQIADATPNILDPSIRTPLWAMFLPWATDSRSTASTAYKFEVDPTRVAFSALGLSQKEVGKAFLDLFWRGYVSVSLNQCAQDSVAS